MIISSSLCLGHVYFLSLSEEKKEEWKHGGKVGTQQVRLTLLLLWLLKRNIVRMRNWPDITILVSRGDGHEVSHGVGHVVRHGNGWRSVIRPVNDRRSWGRSLHVMKCFKSPKSLFLKKSVSTWGRNTKYVLPIPLPIPRSNFYKFTIVSSHWEAFWCEANKIVNYDVIYLVGEDG